MDAPASPGQQTWCLILAYDGTDFQGWQVQPAKSTIQGELQAALGRITGEGPLPQGSGRTDAGVHALGQVASFSLRAPIPPENLLRALNRTLPVSIRVISANTVPTAFHARHSATGKTYEYRISRCSDCSPFVGRYVYCYPWPLDLPALQAAARCFIGEHDFLSFAASDPDVAHRNSASDESLALGRDGASSSRESTVRNIFESAWQECQTEHGNILAYRVRGNGFLHHMVRNLVGTMLDVGRGHMSVEDVPKILAARARSAAGPTAPARGLFLISVDYVPDDLGTRA